jgi:hypothetical protein
MISLQMSAFARNKPFKDSKSTFANCARETLGTQTHIAVNVPLDG